MRYFGTLCRRKVAATDLRSPKNSEEGNPDKRLFFWVLSPRGIVLIDPL